MLVVRKGLLPIIAATTLMLSVPASADPAADAARIAELTLTEDVFAGALEAQAPLIGAALANEFRGMGIEVSDMDTFVDLLFEVMVADFTTRMQQESVTFYLATFSAEELASIRAFYETPAGVSLIDATPALMAYGATTGERVGREIGRDLGPNLAERLEQAGVQVTRDRSMMERLIDALR